VILQDLNPGISCIGVVPIAILATALNGEWAITGQIILLLVLTFGSRMLGFYFAERNMNMQLDKIYCL